MAALVAFGRARRRRRRNIRRERVFRDRTHPLEVFDDEKIYKKFRFHRQAIFELTDEVSEDLEYPAQRKGALSPVLQVLLALRFYATGTFQNAVGDLIGVDQSTVSRTLTRVTDALLSMSRRYITMPTRREATASKLKFYNMQGFPNVFACIDGTQVRISAPSVQEQEYVNRKNFHSLNVQVVCDADLIFINVIAKWPGSVHDAKILRLSPLFAAFERDPQPVDGIILGDSGYMLRPWLMTPIRNPATPRERRYNYCHSSTRTTVERAIGVAKQRWQCLRGTLRVQPEKACKVIVVCFMLHNLARRRRLPPPPSDSSGSELSSSSDEETDVADEGQDEPRNDTERGRTAAGKAARDRLIAQNF